MELIIEISFIGGFPVAGVPQIPKAGWLILRSIQEGMMKVVKLLEPQYTFINGSMGVYTLITIANGTFMDIYGVYLLNPPFPYF